MMELYRVEHLTFAYPACGLSDMQRGDGGREITVLQDCSFQVEEGSFVMLCGGTGSGKTTLLNLLKKELQPVGRLTGIIRYRDRFLADYAYGETAAEVGFVMQNPDEQPVTDKVWHELAFGLENMGVPSEEIRRRVAEISAYFGIDDWYEKAVEELSGGQKQLLNLAAVMVMRPRVLLLDEPTAQLDPIAAQNFMNMIVRLNRELGMTILLAEHRLEETLAVSDRVLVLQGGKLLHDGTPQQIARAIGQKERIYMALPCSARLCRALLDGGEEKPVQKTDVCTVAEKKTDRDTIPLTITQGRQWLWARYGDIGRDDAEQGGYPDTSKTLSAEKEAHASGTGDRTQEHRRAKPILECKQVWFHYKKACDILCGVQFRMNEGEIVSLLGSNGSGKTTFLHVIAGILHASGGKVRVGAERVGYLPQNIETLFVADTVEEELRLVGAEPSERLASYRQVHPYDLSGGEKQILAWEKVLAGKPQLLLLDEPTKGLDAAARRDVGIRLRALADEGVSVLMVTHDIELAAAVSDRCGLLFRGELLALGRTREFFHGNRFYTTAAARISQNLFADVLTAEELTARCRMLDGKESDRGIPREAEDM
ncbi:MAG: ATP-binding cassette domain-containing protein [Lachnospiraceae bacterium]|nr:ATP-binding cassette domain-containing protein [Lachnospiraceae bacterium]